MSEQFLNDVRLDMYLFETSKKIEKLEDIILSNERASSYSNDVINEIFRIMHTIKGSSSMMMFNNIASLAHAIEDLFCYIRDEKPRNVDYSKVSDIILECIDIIKIEVEKLRNGYPPNGESSALETKITNFLNLLTQPSAPSGNQDVLEDCIIKQFAANMNYFKAVIFFEEGAQMENIRAFSIIQNLKKSLHEIRYYPQDIVENDESAQIIQKEGFQIYFKSDYSYETLYSLFLQIVFLKELELTLLEQEKEPEVAQREEEKEPLSTQGEEGKEPEARQTEEEKELEVRQTEEEKEPEARQTEDEKEPKARQTEEGKEPETTQTEEEKELKTPRTEKAKETKRTLMTDRKEMEPKVHKLLPGKREEICLQNTVREEMLPCVKEIKASKSIQNIISVSVTKLDRLMDLVGEMVIAEAMVIQNSDLDGLVLNDFHKASRLLMKITDEIQDMVMAIRMVPLSTTFHKMNRLVRDMCKNLGKEVHLTIVGEETEVDKNIIENISDPLMHLVRNALDHGIESSNQRKELGKPPVGVITLEAKSTGNDILIVIKDDGQGLNKAKILKKAKENNIPLRPDFNLTDKEIYHLILLPGFSTKDKITEYSGRGVGMDVVVKNIEKVGGSVVIDSIPGCGTTFTLKIPMTLAIMDGVNIKVGNSYYTIPTISIKEIFQPNDRNIVTDPDGKEMIPVRGECYKLLKLSELYQVKGAASLSEGIIIMAEQDNRMLCILADALIGQQQVVVKNLPEYIQRQKKIKGLSGCTLLGNGNISLILDIAGLLDTVE